MRPIIIAVAGVASNIGKTTLMCELLRHLPGWEAIKITRGHYRSCGKGPECCVSDLLQAEPVIYSGRTAHTDAPLKDTGRYWAAGAANVHWVIVTGEQVELGIRQALGRVKAPGVLVEGTSFLRSFPADFTIMVIDPKVERIKGSAGRVMGQVQALFSLTGNDGPSVDRAEIDAWLKSNQLDLNLPFYRPADLPALVKRIEQMFAPRLSATCSAAAAEE